MVSPSMIELLGESWFGRSELERLFGAVTIGRRVDGPTTHFLDLSVEDVS